MLRADHPRTVRPDIKGRVCLGELAKGVSSFAVIQDKHRLILEPYVEASKEKWLHGNKAALKQVKQGIKDSAQGKVIKRGNFSKYIKE